MHNRWLITHRTRKIESHALAGCVNEIILTNIYFGKSTPVNTRTVPCLTLCSIQCHYIKLCVTSPYIIDIMRFILPNTWLVNTRLKNACAVRTANKIILFDLTGIKQCWANWEMYAHSNNYVAFTSFDIWPLRGWRFPSRVFPAWGISTWSLPSTEAYVGLRVECLRCWNIEVRKNPFSGQLIKSGNIFMATDSKFPSEAPTEIRPPDL
jgi:hypothetical protein